MAQSQQPIGFFASLNKAGTNINIVVSEGTEVVANYMTAANAISKKTAVKCLVESNREIKEIIPEGSSIQAELDAFNSIKLR